MEATCAIESTSDTAVPVGASQTSTNEFNFSEISGSATYSPQDDKIRLFFNERIPKEDWNALKAWGFTWTMKQSENGGCDMVALWTPGREDVAITLFGEIEDEDQPREERSADRAERFGGYLGKREGEARALAGSYESGPAVHGHQSLRRAQRAAQRHDHLGACAVRQWDKAEYWQSRTAGVIRHALHLERPDVRFRRIKGLEAELRKEQADLKFANDHLDLWDKLVAPLQAKNPEGEETRNLALRVAGSAFRFRVTVPKEMARSTYDTLYDALNWAETPVSIAQCLGWVTESRIRVNALESDSHRIIRHLELRLAYERQMLAGQGGAGVVEEVIEPGGFVAGYQVSKVTKDRAGRISKVYLIPKIDGDRCPRAISAERIKPGSYRSPTSEERTAFAAARAAEKAAEPKGPPLVNPTMEDALRLQAVWNSEAKHPSEPLVLTKEAYKGYMASHWHRAKTVAIDVGGFDRFIGGAACMLRFVGGDKLYGANRVVVLNDAVQKALPITWVPNPMRKALLKLEHISTHELEIWFSRLGGSRTGYMAHGELQRAVLALLEDKPHLAEVK